MVLLAAAPMVRSCQLLLCWLLAAAAALAADASPGVPGADDGVLGGIIGATYMHVRYNVDLIRRNMPNWQSHGEIWLSFAGGIPRLRLLAQLSSPRYGDSKFTLVVDSGEKILYSQLESEDQHGNGCSRWPFPSERKETLEKLRRRMQLVDDLRVAARSRAARMNWTTSKAMDITFAADGSLSSIDLQRVVATDSRLERTLTLEGAESRGPLPHDAEAQFPEFWPPADDCKAASGHPQRRQVLRSSPALRDLLALFSAAATAGTDAGFRSLAALTALALPGDVRSMVDDPALPRLDGDIFFDYHSTVFIGEREKKSSGSSWFSADSQALRLTGASDSRLGPLELTFIALAGESKRVFVNVILGEHRDQQCVEYSYPRPNILPDEAERSLIDVSEEDLTFVEISELNGDDCAIFRAPLPRSRWLYIWVDLDSSSSAAIRLSEVRLGETVLRRMDVAQWTTTLPGIAEQFQPQPEWNCSSGIGIGQLAHLGLHDVHTRSMELQDALYALRRLPLRFALLEFLALPGDVPVIVEEPDLPELWSIPSLRFDYTSEAIDLPSQFGKFSVDPMDSQGIRISAGSPEGTNITVIVGETLMAVRIEPVVNGRQGKTRCSLLPSGLRSSADDAASSPVATAGSFEKVGVINDEVCSRFTYLGMGLTNASVNLWYSKETDAVRQLELLPENGDSSSFDATFRISGWQTGPNPGDDGHGFSVPGEWVCEFAEAASEPWLHLASSAPTERRAARGDAPMPAAGVLADLAEAAGIVGLLPPPVADRLSRLVITLPEIPPAPAAASATNTPPAAAPAAAPTRDPREPRDPLAAPATPAAASRPAASATVFGPLRSFSFNFSSTWPLQGDGAQGAARRSRGTGEVFVDLERQRFMMRSAATGVSPGLPHVESWVVLRGDYGRLYARTRTEGFEQCWSLRTLEAMPAPPSFSAGSVNPLSRARYVAEGIPLPSGRRAKKYAFDLDVHKRVQLLVDDEDGLVALNFDDLRRDVTAGINIHGWDTRPVPDSIFEEDQSWNCEHLRVLDYAEQLAEWDLLRVFLGWDGANSAGRGQ